MKIINKLKTMGCCILASLTLAACSGTAADEGGTLTLNAGKSTIDANGKDKVVFTVTFSGRDVTKEAEVRCVTTGQVVTDATFTVSEPNTYVFEALYGNSVSEQVSVTAYEVKPSEFLRKVCIMEITAISCSFCPTGYRRIEEVMNDYPEQLYLISMHPESYSGTEDPMGIPQTAELEKMFKIGEYPYAIVDMRDATDTNTDKVRGAFQKSLNEYPARCGVSVSSVYNESDSKTQVTVKVHSEKEADYRIALYLVEDGIVSLQNDNGIWSNDYVHHKVARRIVGDNVSGEKFGRVLRDEEVTKSWEIPLEQSWNIDKLYIYALVIDEDGTVNNMNACLVKNGDSGYSKVDNENRDF